MKLIDLLYWGMLILSIVLIYFAMKFYSKSKDLMRTGVKTTATVVQLIPVQGDDGVTYKPVFEYTNRRQETIIFRGEVSSSPPAYKVGEKVKIVYDPNSDDRKVISFWGLYRWVVVLLCIASPLLIIGGGYVLYMNR